jgi:hypothetical protein
MWWVKILAMQSPKKVFLIIILKSILNGEKEDGVHEQKKKEMLAYVIIYQ